MLLEVREEPTSGPGCSAMDRRTFRIRTLARLEEEFGERLEVSWEEPARTAATLPTLFLGGQLVHRGGYLVWEVLRPIVASALALEAGVRELEGEAREALERLGIEADDWQEGLLAWVTRRQRDDDDPVSGEGG